MQFDRTGFILYTSAYEDCVHFYAHVLELTVMFKTDILTCFEFGDAYLMVEVDDECNGNVSKQERQRSCLRINVPNVRQVADRLIKKNIAVDYQEYYWGTVAKFKDPDGNLCAFKDSATFEEQLKTHYEQP